MAREFFFARGDAEHGPYTAIELRELASTGVITPADLVWRAGSPARILAAQVKGLFTTAPPPPLEPAPESAPGIETAVEAPAAGAAEAVTAPPAMEVEKEKPAAAKPRAKRVVSIKGGVLVSQDGTYVQYRRKCEKCGYTDPGRSNTVIRPGSMKIPFFCRKCRKGRTVEMMAVG